MANSTKLPNVTIVHKRRRARGPAPVSPSLLQRVADASPSIIFVYDLLEDAVVYSNRPMAPLLGYRQDEYPRPGREFVKLVIEPDELAALLDQHVPRFNTARDGEVIDIEGALRHADGTWRRLYSRNVVFSRCPDGSPKQILGMAEDVTEHERERARLRQLQRLARQQERLVDIEAIAVSLAHDLRSPLGNISLEAYMLVEQAKRGAPLEASQVAGAAQRLTAEAQRLDGLITGFLSLAPKQGLDRKQLKVPDFLQSVLTPWFAAAKERHISLRLACPDDVPALSADEEKLRRVVDHLIRNAFEAIDQGPGRVDIEVSVPEAERVRISIRDTGPGVPEAVQVFRIFETTKTQGLGLGLTLARQVVVAHGGTIWYEQVKPHGVVFHLQLRCER